MKQETAESHLRSGYTTGSCAAAAAKAALLGCLTGKVPKEVQILLPGGQTALFQIEKAERTGQFSICAVRKDAGDDPDVTDGILVFAKVSLQTEKGGGIRVLTDGGEGIGRVTRPGLDQPVGAAAINSTPRRMIEETLRETFRESGRNQGVTIRVIISIPGGEELAAKTFNPKLGIKGGLSILGSSGIVEPRSTDALLQTIRTEIGMHRAEGDELLNIVPGNYGKEYLKEYCKMDPEDAVTCSNYVEDTVKMAADAGFRRIFFAGHAGKLIKVAGGMGNTHSAFGDRRMEITLSLVKEIFGIDEEERLREGLLSCVSMDGAVELLKKEGMDDRVFHEAAKRVRENISAWTDGRIDARVVIFTKQYGTLGES